MKLSRSGDQRHFAGTYLVGRLLVAVQAQVSCDEEPPPTRVGVMVMLPLVPVAAVSVVTITPLAPIATDETKLVAPGNE